MTLFKGREVDPGFSVTGNLIVMDTSLKDRVISLMMSSAETYARQGVSDENNGIIAHVLLSYITEGTSEGILIYNLLQTVLTIDGEHCTVAELISYKEPFQDRRYVKTRKGDVPFKGFKVFDVNIRSIHDLHIFLIGVMGREICEYVDLRACLMCLPVFGPLVHVGRPFPLKWLKEHVLYCDKTEDAELVRMWPQYNGKESWAFFENFFKSRR